MKFAVYTTMKIDPSSVENILKSLKERSEVTESFILNPETLELRMAQGKIEFYAAGKLVTKEMVDVIIVRGGFRDPNTTIQFIQYCISVGIKVFDNNLHTVRYFINKKSDTIKLAQNNIPIPATTIYPDISYIPQDIQFPVVMKTSNTGQGKGVWLVHSFDEIERVLVEEEKRISSFLFQEFIDYEMDLRLVVIGDEVVGAMQRIPGEGEFRANFSLGGDVVKIDAPEQMKELAVRAAKACECECAGVDVLVDRQGKYYILEANRTPGLTGISKALGINVADKLVDHIIKTRK